MKNIAIVLPAYNIGGNIKSSLNKINFGIKQFPDHNFVLYVVDDCSIDNTPLAIERWIGDCSLRVIFHKNKENLGLVRTLKETYKNILESDIRFDYILKTDSDDDFDQKEVIVTLLSEIFDADLIVGNRKLKEYQYSNYEQSKRKEIFCRVEKNIGYIDEKLIDPASVGSQLYKRDSLKELIEHNIIRSFNETKGLDFLIPLVAHRLVGKNIRIVDLKNVSYDVVRRSDKKVGDNYDVYSKIIDLVLNNAEKDSQA